jgi:phage shock protein C
MSEQKRLYRSSDDRMIAGVCAGLAEYMDIDPTLVRLAMVLFTLVGGSGILVYVIAWIIMPEHPEELPNV